MESKDLFEKIKQQLLIIDPVSFVENYLTLDGQPFRLHKNGFKPFADIYRYVGVKALERDAKPVIIVKGRQVGGTTMAAALEMYFMGCGLFGGTDKPPMRIVHAFPQLELAAAYTKSKLNPIISTSKLTETKDRSGKQKSYLQNLLDDSNKDTSDSLKFKEFKGGNHIWIESIGLTGDRIRGRTADGMFFDEVQDMTDIAIGNSKKILTASQYGPKGDGIQVYFGTPKKKGSPFFKMWMTSNQQYFYLGCEKCNKHFPLYTPGSNEWEKIWIREYTVKCTHCEHEQDKREAAERGKWIGTKPLEESLMVGFHINQLYLPYYTKERVLQEKPDVNPINTERIYQNEVLGEFFHGDTSPISAEEIREHCADFERKFRARIEPSENLIVTLGIDYGARADMEQLAQSESGKIQGQSYSTAVVLVAKGPELLSIEFATKFKKNDVESKKGIIDQIFRQYSVNLAVGDIGYSNDFSSMLQNSYGDKYLVSRAAPKINNKIKFNQDIFPKEIAFERDFYLQQLFEKMKSGHIRFPFGDYEKIAWLINHCSSMEIKPSISRVGEPSIHYVKGSTPNDGIMSLLNAYLAYLYIVSSGFTDNNPFSMKARYSEQSKPLVTAAYIPRKF